VPSHVWSIARFTLLEAWRTRLPLLAAAVLAVVWAGSLFIHGIAITESERMQWSFFAAGARLASVVMLALYVTSSIVREFNEKGLEIVLALDLPRSSYLLGKLSGFVGVAALLALLAALPLLAHVPPAVAAVWGTSLFLELTILGALGLFCIVSLNQVLPAFMLIVGFYLLARTIGAMQLMADTPLLGSMGGARPVLDFGVEALAYVVPALDRFTATRWIAAQAVDPAVLGAIVLQTLITVALLLGAALFDFYRREV
jgi:hypothetical protein